MNAKYIPISLEEAKAHYAGFEVTDDGASHYELTTRGEVKSFGTRDRVGQVKLIIPNSTILHPDGHEFWPLDCEGYGGHHPYGKVVTEGIAYSVFHAKWKEHRFGIVPGNFHFGNGGVCFRVELDPSHGDSWSVLFYSDASMKHYAGVNELSSFNFGDTGLYGLLLPMNYLIEPHRTFVGRDIFWLRDQMSEGLVKYQML